MPQPSQHITVNDLLGRPPGWLLRSGISLLFSIVLLGLTLAAFIRYPDKLIGKLEVNYTEAPVSLSAPTTTPIAQLWVTNSDSIQIDQPLVLFTSDTNWEELQLVEHVLANKDINTPIPKLNQLGSLQSTWSNWVDAYTALQHFERHNGLNIKLNNLHQEQIYTHKLLDITKQRLKTSIQQLQLEEVDYGRQQSLAQSGIISTLDLENKEKAWLEQQNQHRNQEIEQIQLQLRLNTLYQQLVSAKQDHEHTLFQLQQELIQAEARLLGDIRHWRNQYLLTAPTSGQVQLPSEIIVGQTVSAGRPVLTIMPYLDKHTSLIATICLPPQGSGKVALGDRLLLHLDAWPSTEYGTLTANITQISPIPENNDTEVPCRILTANLSHPLRTNYGKTIIPLPQMIGNATIITAERSLLGRIFVQFRELMNLTTK